MKVQVLVDGLDKGTVDLAGAELLPYANAVANFNELISAVYSAENPNGPDWLDVRGSVNLRRLRRQAARRSAAR